MKHVFRLIFAAVFSCCMFVPVAQAAQLTVFDGTATQNTVPINVYWLDDDATQTQVIYPADQLTEMIGRPINSMKFYVSGTSDYQGGLVTVSLGTVEQVNFSSNEFVETGLTQVATVTLSAGVSEVLITFDEPFVYQGGNLLLDTRVTEVGTYGNAPFLGVNPYYPAAKSRSQQVSFIPKTTFDYVPAEYAAAVSPGNLVFKPIRVGNEEELSVVIKNAGQNPITPVISVDAPFSVSVVPAALQNGESIEVPVKFSPTTEGDFNGSMTVDCGAAGTYVVELEGKGLPEADEFTVCDDTYSSSSLPVYSFYYDLPGGVSQMIYPAEKLTDLIGREIFALTFYPTDNVGISGGKIQVSLKMTDQEVFESAVPITGMTLVATVVPVAGTELFEIFFDEPFTYTGGNLAIGTVVTEAGQFSNKKFYGEKTTGVTSYFTYSSNFGNYSNTDKFLPKVTFTCTKQEQPQVLRGDVNRDKVVNISDVTELIDMLLNGSETNDEADCNLDTRVDISDVTALIDFLLSGIWAN